MPIRQWLEQVVADVRYGARKSARSPGLTALIVITLAVGIGATTAIFSQFRAIYLEKLPVENPEALRVLQWSEARAPLGIYDAGRVSYAAYVDLRDESKSFSDVACWSGAFTNLGNRSRVETRVVSGNYFRTLGIHARLGRTITIADEAAASSVAVISYAEWQRQFGGDPNVLGRQIRVNGVPLVLIGVMPQGFFGLNPAQAADLYVPLSMYSSVRFRGATAIPRRLDDDSEWRGGACELLARLAPGVSDVQAEAEADRLVRNRFKQSPAYDPSNTSRIWIIDASHGLNNLRRSAAEPLTLLGVATGLLLLAACTNVAALLMARVRARSAEIGNRVVVGASWGRLVRQHLTESFMLAVAGGAAGVPLAYLLNDLFPGPLSSRMTAGVFLGKVAPNLDVSVLGFCLLVCTVASLAFGLLPALRAARVEPVAMIQSGTRTTASRGESRGGRILVAGQVAIAVVVMVGAGLLVRTLINLGQAPLGFDDSDAVVFFSVRLGPSGYVGAEGIEFFDRALRGLGGVPGVAIASGEGFGARPAICPDQTGGAAARVRDSVRIDTESVAPRYFKALGVPLLAGREVSPGDTASSGRVAVVNAAFARRYPELAVPGTVVPDCQRGAPPWTIVGVVADSRTRSIRGEVTPSVYIPFRQNDPKRSFLQIRFALRTLGNPAQVMPGVRRVMADINPDMPLIGVETGAELHDSLLHAERQTATVLIVFGGVALFLSCLGIYGVVSYAVSRRFAEIGVRMAVGATSSRIMCMIVAESVRPVALGIAAGLLCSPALTRWMQAMLFGVSRADPATIAAVSLAFLLTGALAAYLPARRAASIHPMSALRSD